jgi:hypothetical protein
VAWLPPRPGGGAPAASGGPYSPVIVRMWFIFGSNVSVLAPAIVGRSCFTAKLVGLSSLTIVMVPLPRAPASRDAGSLATHRLARIKIRRSLKAAPQLSAHGWVALDHH